MKTYRATVWLEHNSDPIRKELIEYTCKNIEDFKTYVRDEVLMSHDRSTWSVSFGPISEKK